VRAGDEPGLPELLPPDDLADIAATADLLKATGGARREIITYVVQEGDTVYSIAESFGLEPETIIAANPSLAGRPNWLSIGQTLRILPVDGALHVVQSGDTLLGIAARYGVDVQDILDWPDNELSDPNKLRVGQELLIPGGSAPASPRRVQFTGSVPENAAKGSGSFIWPAKGPITQYYHKRHRAIDIAAYFGTTVVAADAGFVIQAGWDALGYGECIVIDHGNGYRTLYAHLSGYLVEAGVSVQRGQPIGKVGRSGNVSGTHLHFEIIGPKGKVDPISMLP